MQYQSAIRPGGSLSSSYEYPPVDTLVFSNSVGQSRILLQQAEMLLAKLSDNEFATKIMELSQEGKQDSVNQMLHSIIGFNMDVKTVYSPTGVTFTLKLPTASNQHAPCCHVEMGLQWGK